MTPTPCPAVLIAEDDIHVAEFIQRHLVSYGYRVRCVGTAHSLFEALPQEPWSAILVNMVLPDMRAPHLLASLFEYDVKCPVIVVTAAAEPDAATLCIRAGAGAVIRKPFSADELALVVGQACDRFLRDSIAGEVQRVALIAEAEMPSAPAVSSVYDVESHETSFFGPSLLRALGYSEQDEPSLLLHHRNGTRPLIHPEDAHTVSSLTERYRKMQPGDFISVEYRVIDAKGQWQWIALTAMPFLLPEPEQKTHGKILSTFYIITRKKEFERLLLDENRRLAMETASKAELLRRSRDAERRTGEALRESKTLIDNIHTKLPIGVVRMHQKKGLLYANAFLAHLLGFSSADELLNVAAAHVIAQLHTPDLFSEQQPATRQLELLRKDGLSAWVEMSLSLGNDLDGSLYYDAVIIDITERKRIEIQLAANEERYKRLVEEAPVGILETTRHSLPTDKLEYLSNKEFVRITGYTPEEFFNLDHQITFEEDLALEDKLYDELARGDREHYALEQRLRRKDGSVAWTRVVTTLLRQEREKGRKSVSLLQIIEDISDRRQTEQKLQASEERFRRIFERAPIGIIELESGGDQNPSACRVNPRFTAITGYTAEEYIDVRGPGITPREQLEYEQYLYAKMHGGEIDSFELEQSILCKDGTRRWIHFLVSALERKANGHMAILILIEDINDRKNAEQEVQRQQRVLEEQAVEIEEINVQLREHVDHLSETNLLLQQLNNEKNLFLGIASHDLKNPLASILMTSTMLESYGDRLSAEEIRRQLARIKHQATTMSNIIANFLSASAIDSGELSLQPEEVDTEQIARDVVLHHSDRANEKGQKLLLQPPPHPLPVVADVTAFTQIIDNLVSNAIKYTPQGGTVSVSWHAHTHRAVAIRVSDTGPGIPPEEIDLLFHRFRKLSARPTASEHSTGLGLAIVKKLTELMGGTVRCESTPGQGATFVVELPAPDPQNR